ncbi:hypothetical protein GCM10011575_03840 [Microlunatus endophyticus]|uniref:PDZ domain-containing protein n=1 Tax=Microlunatus endophyticus TaxID=1716077 RepID=A0A917W185_9ACTN|nr:trypsin-like peptidase domain-containing protein [Microlunatus endophyticus]GGL48989.1 hypothetical protein GCM10011575_03840 [Microlunatus endophyticus]
MPRERRAERNRGGQLRRIGAGLGAGALAVGVLAGPVQAAHAADLVDWGGYGGWSYSRGYSGGQEFGWGGQDYGQNGQASGQDGQGSGQNGQASGQDGQGSGQDGESDGQGSTTSGEPASSSESKGVVLIDTEDYDGSEAAGTGIVLTASGTVVTNYHVVEGSTSIKVTVASTGKTYTGKLVGADQSSDVAVLKLSGASGLATATIDKDTLSVGDDVTAVGNAGGTGTLTQAAGEVTALNQKITTEAEDNVAGETLTGLVQTNADVEPGDSGGPLLDSQGEVTGIDAAASSGGATQGYAIPISSALTIVDKIESGRASSEIRIGAAAYLGVEVTATDEENSSDEQSGSGSYDDPFGYGGSDQYGDQYGDQNGDAQSTSGAAVEQVQDGTPAAKAGLAAGDVITRLGSTTIGSADDLTTALKNYKPGQQVTIGWTDADGQQHTTSVTLGSSPVN